MLDEEYQPGDVGDYGARAQPALVASLSPQLRMTQVGNIAAVLASVAAVGAIATFPNFAGGPTGSGWAVGAFLASIVLLVICTYQHVAWRRAMAEWRGDRDYDLASLTRISWVLHLVSYAPVLFGLWASIAGSVAAGPTARASALLAVALLLMVIAQVLAGVQYLRVSGPSGTIPAHLRRLSEAIQLRR